MTAFKNLPSNVLARRLVSAFCAVLLLTVVGSGIGIWSLADIDAATRKAITQDLGAERIVADAYRLQAINSALYKAMALSSEPEVGEVLSADVEGTERQFGEQMQRLRGHLQSKSDLALLARTEDAATDFKAAVKELMAARDSGLTERIHSVYTQRFQPSSAALLEGMARLAQSQRDAIDTAGGQIAQLSASARLALMLFSTAATLLGVVLTLWLVRSICRPIKVAGETARRVSSFDLREDIQGHSRDEAGQMLLALGSMQDALRQIVLRVRDSVESVRIGAHEIAHGNSDLSVRTEAAASSLNETTVALEQVMRHVRQSSDGASRAEKMAGSAAELAVQCGAVVSQVVKTMQDIDRSSDKVVDIVGVIDSIAFQTNILALNAAVEAARAGESGKGFSVVAAEVRQLATRSALAAREIKELISASAQSIQTGTVLADGAGRTMSGVMTSIRQVADTVSEITAAAQVQIRDIGQINDAVAQLDQMTQQNSALVEESAAAAEGLRVQARELEVLISEFVLPKAHRDVADGHASAPGHVPRVAAALPAPGSTPPGHARRLEAATR